MSRRGFTLIELLVVIAIIAILAAILFPVFAKARESASLEHTDSARTSGCGMCAHDYAGRPACVVRWTGGTPAKEPARPCLPWDGLVLILLWSVVDARPKLRRAAAAHDRFRKVEFGMDLQGAVADALRDGQVEVEDIAALVLHYGHGCPIREIARRMGESPAKACRRLCAVRRALAEADLDRYPD